MKRDCGNRKLETFLMAVAVLLFLALPAFAAQGHISTFAGNGNYSFSGDGGQATSASLSNPEGVAVDSSGNIYIADTYNNRIRKVDTSGVITTVAGNGTPGFVGDGGPATSASFYFPPGVAVDSSGNIYIADYGNNRIRKVDTSGVITTFAGSGTYGFGGDGGQATSASLDNPIGVAGDSSGNIYIADLSNNRIRKVDTSGVITTIAGNGTAGFAGDGGQATSANLNEPFGVTVDSSGNIYISDYGNNRIRKVDTLGVITTAAGNGTAGFAGDGGQATSASLYNPWGVAVDSSGNIYIADTYNYRIRKMDTLGVITTAAGNGTWGFGGDGGQATSASINPYGVAVDSSGNIYIADLDNNRIRKVEGAADTCGTPPSGMVAWWAGDNSAIDIVGGNNGTLVNGATFAPGKVEQAFSFDGVDQFVQAADSASLDVPTAITLDAWINTADPSASQPIMAKAQASGNWNSYYFAIGGDGNLYFEVDNISVGHYGVWRTSFSPSANTWYHVAATWQNVNGDGTDARIYINAVDQSAPLALNQGYDSGFALYYTSLPFYVGRSEMGSSYFKGLVDEVEIFDRALTAEEIAAIYVAGSAGKCKELFTITASAPGGHGKISCKPATVNYGNGSSCTISPDIGYHLQSLTDNADDVTGSVVNNKYDLSNITDNHNIVARFEMRNGPDLRGNWIDLAYYKKIKSLKVNVKIQNIGNRNARDFVVSFYLSSNGRDPDTLLRNITVNGLSAGKSRVLSLEYRSKCQLSGKYLVVVIDSKKQVNELNENNNRMVRLIH